MTDYRRTRLPGATWFFTVNLAERHGNRLLVERIDVLRAVFRTAGARHSFHLEAVVIPPDHLHCFWTLPDFFILHLSGSNYVAKEKKKT